MNWHRHSILVAKQREIRDLLLKAARMSKDETRRVRLAGFADDAEETAELITLLENAMRTADQAVKDLLTVDAAKDATITDLKAKLADAETRAIQPDTLDAVNIAAPEAPQA